MRLKITVFESRKNGQFYWRVRAANGAIVLTAGEGYTRRNNAKQAIARIAEYSAGSPLAEACNSFLQEYELKYPTGSKKS